MRAHPRRDTKPELKLRRALHALGLRYRVDVQPEPSLRRRADLVFRRARVAVFVDGCFWHGCPEHSKLGRSNRTWWASKLAGNRMRDADTTTRLGASGWTVIRVWEHDDMAAAAGTIAQAVRGSAPQLA
jgi:DNA mismatch endonuclease, patch repair protein